MNPFAIVVSALAALVALLVSIGALLLAGRFVALGLPAFGWVGYASGFDLALFASSMLWPLLVIFLMGLPLALAPAVRSAPKIVVVGRVLNAVNAGVVSGVAAFVFVLLAAVGGVLLVPSWSPDDWLVVILGVSVALAALMVQAERSPRHWRLGRPPKRAALISGLGAAAALGAASLDDGVGAAVAIIWIPALLALVLEFVPSARPWWSVEDPVEKPPATYRLQGPAVSADEPKPRSGVRVLVGAAAAVGVFAVPASFFISLAVIGLAAWAAVSPAVDRHLVPVRRSPLGKTALIAATTAVFGIAAVVPAQLTPWHTFPVAYADPGSELRDRAGTELGVIWSGSAGSLVVRCDARKPNAIEAAFFPVPAAQRGQMRIADESFDVRVSHEATLLGALLRTSSDQLPYASAIEGSWRSVLRGPNAKTTDTCGRA